MNDIVSIHNYDFIDIFGFPTRYVFKETPMDLYIRTEDDRFNVVKAHNVDFEVACDLLDIADVNNGSGLCNPHVINIMEPGLDGCEVGCYISHSVILNDELYDLLLSYTNTENCRGYVGVVNGYAVNDLREHYHRPIPDTGLCLIPAFVSRGGLTYSDIPFNETSHKRYIQASQSYRMKILKEDAHHELLKKMSEPIIYKPLHFDNQLYDCEYC